MLQSEIILHEKIRDKIQDFRSFGIDPFMISNIPETEMSYVLSQIPDRFFAKKRELKKAFHRESEYRTLQKIKMKCPIQGKLDFGLDNDIDKVFIKTVNKMERTILVVYSNTLPKPNERGLKRYAFNTSDDLVEGDMIKSPEYTTNMVVVSVLDAKYKYFNANTGDLTNTFNNSRLYPIRTLKLVDVNEDIITATKINK
ncbi:hypothetical protein [Tenacibaculum sp.]|uniref:hypothetical protein n=1 Tax=Tenacibaculum sp. TaxID=1906242 RepID=UPI003D0BE5F7